jgi:nitrite reductase (NADH) large subunit
MFYVRTADRLQRTSTWRDNLEGGLDYLKDVVVNDSLGLGAELQRRSRCRRTSWSTSARWPASPWRAA